MSYLKIFMGQPENIAIKQVVGAKGRKIGNVTVNGDNDSQKSLSVVSSVTGITAPHYKIYTLLSSGETFVMFSTLWLLQIVSIWCKNCLKSPIFKGLSYFDRCLHSFYSVIIPFPSKDWSDGEGDCAQP